MGHWRQSEMQMTDKNQETTSETPADSPLNFDNWIGEQPDPVKSLLDGHIGGLKSALQAERESRKELEKRMKGVSDQLEAGSQAREQLQQLSQQLKETELRATFTETAVAAGVQPNALRLAYLAAKDAQAFSDDGKPDMDKLRSDYPHLFTKAVPTPTAGAGTKGQLAPTVDPMDDIIRRKAGRT
jgi:hypothetical protein